MANRLKPLAPQSPPESAGRKRNPPARIEAAAVYSAVEAAALLRMRPDRIYEEIRAGRLKARKDLGRHLLLGEWLLAWVRGEFPVAAG